MRNRISNPDHQAERFAGLTKTLIRNGNVARARKLLAYAERLMLDGSAETRAAISNVYVHSISTFLELRHCRIANLFPPALKSDYIRQVNAIGA